MTEGDAAVCAVKETTVFLSHFEDLPDYRQKGKPRRRRDGSASRRHLDVAECDRAYLCRAERPTLSDLFDALGVSWRYYGTKQRKICVDSTPRELIRGTVFVCGPIHPVFVTVF